MADTDNQRKTFDIQFDVAAKATGKMRTEAVVRLSQTGEEWEMVSDEGGFHGGGWHSSATSRLFCYGNDLLSHDPVSGFCQASQFDHYRCGNGV